VDYLQALRLRRRLQTEMAAALRDVDLYVTVPFAGPSLAYTNLTGHPSLILRCGMLDGLPQSLELIGGLYRDYALLRVGLAYSVYALTGSTLASATTLLASLLPQVAFGSLAGVYVDRWDRRRTLVVTNLLLAAGLLPLLAVHHRADVWIIYLVTAVESGVAQFAIAAEAALVPNTVPAERLVAANALNGQNRDVARLVGAALGGVLAGLGGIAALTVTDVASFAVAAGTVALLRLRADAVTVAPPRHHVLREWADGARIALRGPTLRAILLFVALTSVGEAVMGTLMAPFVRDVLHGSAQAYGLIGSVQAVGGIAGGLVVAAFGSRFSPRALVGYGAVAFGALDLVLFLYPLLARTLWPAFACMVVVGLPGAFMSAGLVTLFQSATTDRQRGRVFGAANAVEAAAMLAGALGAGTLAGRLGIVPVIAVQGAGYCVTGVLMLLLLPASGFPYRTVVGEQHAPRVELGEPVEPGPVGR